MTQKRIKTKVPGVRYREHPTRKHGLQPDRYFFIRYRVDGDEKEEGLGWASEGWTVAKAADTLAELKRNARTGEGEKTLAEKRAKAEAVKQAELERRRAEQEALEAAQNAEREKRRLDEAGRFGAVFASYCESNAHKKSLYGEISYIRKWVLPSLGRKMLGEILPLDIERIKRTMLKAGKSPRSVELCLALIRQVFHYGRSQRLFSGESPTREVKSPRYNNGRLRFLTVEEAERLFAELRRRSEQTWAMSTISLQCGLRFGELANLKWQCVDLDQGTLTLLDTKNGRTRIAPMTEAVRGIFAGMDRGAPNALVFPDRFGKVMRRISPAFFRAVDALGLNAGVEDRRMRLVFHSLRHTYGSRLIESGADMAVVRDLLGHRDFTMLSRYAHSGANSRKQAVAAMEAMLLEQGRAAKIIPLPKRAGE